MEDENQRKGKNRKSAPEDDDGTARVRREAEPVSTATQSVRVARWRHDSLLSAARGFRNLTFANYTCSRRSVTDSFAATLNGPLI